MFEKISHENSYIHRSNVYIVMAKNIGILGIYDQRRLWKRICIFNPFDILRSSQKSNLSLDNKNLKRGKISLWNVFLKYTLDTTIGTPKEFLCKISPYWYSQFWGGDYENVIIQPQLPVSQKYK